MFVNLVGTYRKRLTSVTKASVPTINTDLFKYLINNNIQRNCLKINHTIWFQDLFLFCFLVSVFHNGNAMMKLWKCPSIISKRENLQYLRVFKYLDSSLYASQNLIKFDLQKLSKVLHIPHILQLLLTSAIFFHLEELSCSMSVVRFDSGHCCILLLWEENRYSSSPILQ